MNATAPFNRHTFESHRPGATQAFRHLCLALVHTGAALDWSVSGAPMFLLHADVQIRPAVGRREATRLWLPTCTQAQATLCNMSLTAHANRCSAVRDRPFFPFITHEALRLRCDVEPYRSRVPICVRVSCDLRGSLRGSLRVAAPHRPRSVSQGQAMLL